MRTYETYEFLEYGALLGTLAEFLVALKVPGFFTAIPFAMLPLTLCSGFAVYLHGKLPKKRQKTRIFGPSLISSHPASGFFTLAVCNFFAFLYACTGFSG